MLTELSDLRAELRAKRGFRKALAKELKQTEGRRLERKISSLDKRIAEHENMIAQLRLRREEHIRRHKWIVENKRKQKELIKYVGEEICGLKFLIGYVGGEATDGKRRPSASVERRGFFDSHRQSTLRWLVRLGQLIRAKDEDAIDRMMLDLAKAMVEGWPYVGDKPQPYDKWCSSINWK